MARSEADKTVAAVAKALAGNHPPDVERTLISIAVRAIESEPQCDFRVAGGRCVQRAGHGGIGHIVGDQPTERESAL